MPCLVCGYEDSDFACEGNCAKVLNEVAIPIVQLFLKQNEVTNLKALAKVQGDRGDLFSIDKKQEVLDELFKNTGIGAFLRKPDLHKKTKQKPSVIILRAKFGRNIREVATSNDMSKEQMLKKHWTEKLTADGFTPDFKVIY